MSCYLTIKKNGTRIGTWSKSTKAFSLFHGADYTEKEFDPVSVFKNAIAEIRAEIPDYEKRIRVAKLSLEGCMDADERYYLASSIVEYEDEIKDCERIIIEIEFILNNCVECDLYDEHTHWTWVLE